MTVYHLFRNHKVGERLPVSDTEYLTDLASRTVRETDFGEFYSKAIKMVSGWFAPPIVEAFKNLLPALECGDIRFFWVDRVDVWTTTEKEGQDESRGA